LVPLALLFAFLAGCPGAPATPAAEPRIIRTYEVPTGTAEDVRNAINRLTQANKDGVAAEATAQVLPDGRVAVYGSERFQAGVQQLLSGVAPQPSSPTLTFWLWQVRAVPGTGTIPPALEHLRPALEEVTRTLGPMDFALVEPTLLTLASGEDAKTTRPKFGVSVRASARGDAIVAWLMLSMGERTLGTTLQLEQDKTVVIGQTMEDAPKEGPPSMVFLLVRASAAHGATQGK
jgi:hypothetical protein